jgi:hypothetical protein
VRRDDLPYALPEPGAPVRVAFVGQRTYFEPAALTVPRGGLIPTFIDYRGGGETGPLHDALRRCAPHVVVVFRPDALPAGAMDGVEAPVLGVLTEPLARADREPHPNYDYNMAELRRLDPNNVDRVVCADANSWAAAESVVPVWRAMPLPVDDRFYRTPTPSRRPPRIVFIGHSTMHREESLVSLKHEFDIPHYAHALMGDELREVLHGADVGLNVHGEQWVRAFEHSVLLHLAAGQLVVTEVLEPLYGLEPGIDVLEVSDRYELNLRVHQLIQMPDMHDRIRIRGHHKSRQFAASKVWPRVIGDLFADFAAFGTARRAGAGVTRA